MKRDPNKEPMSSFKPRVDTSKLPELEDEYGHRYETAEDDKQNIADKIFWTAGILVVVISLIVPEINGKLSSYLSALSGIVLLCMIGHGLGFNRWPRANHGGLLYDIFVICLHLLAIAFMYLSKSYPPLIALGFGCIFISRQIGSFRYSMYDKKEKDKDPIVPG